MQFPITTARAALSTVLALLLSVSALMPAHAATIGEQKTVVILVNFLDKATQPKTKSELHSLVFGQVSDFFWEASYQKTFLSGDTFGWFTIPMYANNCDTAQIAAAGNQAATAAGANLSAYTQIVYMFPANSGCGWSGVVGTGVGGQKLVFANYNFDLKNIAHEMGHNFGLQHSDSMDCGTSALGSTCTTRSYGDDADTMGGRAAHFNAFQKERLGWLNGAGTPTITTVANSGRYVISPMENGGGAKALKILKSTDPVTGKQTWFYVEYRQALGFDTSLGTVGNLTKGVLIHTGVVASTGIGTSLLLDMTPGSTSMDITDFEDSALTVGSSFTDPVSGVTISLAAADASGATIDVSVSGSQPAPVCTRSAPTLSLSGPTSSVAAGSTVTYTVNVSNKDSSACAATTFNLAKSLPSGWSGALANAALSLSPGTSGSTTLSVTSPSGAGAGSYGVGTGVSSSVGSVHTASASATYTVAAPAGGAVLSETVGTDKSSYLRAETVYMSALVKNNGAAVAGASVKFTVTLPGGSTALVNATSGSDGYARGTYRIAKGRSAIGTYGLRADATLAGASTSASAGFNVR